jgi:putative FmdB family regulatory protein
MPLYEYECGACGHRFEVIQRFSDAPIDVCPKCAKGPVNKLLSAPAFQFKGTGWYVSDYGKSGSSAPPKSDAPAPDAGKAESPAPKEASKDAAKADPAKKDSKIDT